MGKFSGVLIASDFDNTLVYTEEALRLGLPTPPMSDANRQAIQDFMAQGGIFSIATGRALPAFAPVWRDIPMNGPTVLFNGAAIYDFPTATYLYKAFLPEAVRPCVQQVLDAFPQAAVEIYHDDNNIHAVHPNALTEQHVHLTHAPTVTAPSVEDVPSPFSKALFEVPCGDLQTVLDYIRSQSWSVGYEVIPSSEHLVELTAKGANKGGMVLRLAEMLGIDRRHVYCAGDHANDVPMLTAAARGFAPVNAIEEVRRLPDIHILPDARQDAVAAMIGELHKIY